jgi:2'-5' RNA ligase
MENRPFSPHITLAREVRGLAGELPPPPRFIVPVTALTLMNSERLNGLLTYTPLHAKALFINK